MRQFDSLDKMCQDALADLVSAEQQILKALPGIIEAASSTELHQALLEQIKISESQLARLKETAFLLDGTPLCDADTEDVRRFLHDDHGRNCGPTNDDELLDANRNVGCHRVEHYEIAAYAELISCMKELEKQSSLLIDSLAEEVDPDDRLSQLVMKVAKHPQRESFRPQNVAVQHC